MDDYSVYSFDIFDTLLVRPYINPQELWKVLEENEGATGFYKARKAADEKTYEMATKRGGETTIEEAYANMHKRYRSLKEKEMELEREVLKANPEMVKLWCELGNQGKKRVVISDMYMPANFIKGILKENGISGWDGFYLSSERNARKTTGKLFEIMLKEQSIRPSEVLHIGDNKWSDVRIPQQMGIKTRHYKKNSTRLLEDFPFMRETDDRLAGALSTVWGKYIYENTNYNYWNKIGFSIAGVLGYLYVKWIVETSVLMGFNHLMFVGRDGYILKKICNELYPDIKTDYFYASRLTSVAVLGAIGSDPIAIKERENYKAKYLSDVDSAEAKNDYGEYLKKFEIDENTVLVDGCSSGFSAQRLVEATVGHKVFTFYLTALAKMYFGGALYSTNLRPLPFQNLSEFVFSAPTPPIKAINGNGPVFSDKIDRRESFKMEVSEDVASGAIISAKALAENKVCISTDDWMNYFNSFMYNLTSEDKKMLSKAQNATDVEQKNFYGVIREAYPKCRIRKKIFNFNILTSYFSYSNTYLQWKHLLFNHIWLNGYKEKKYDEKVIVK